MLLQFFFLHYIYLGLQTSRVAAEVWRGGVEPSAALGLEQLWHGLPQLEDACLGGNGNAGSSVGKFRYADVAWFWRQGVCGVQFTCGLSS